MKNFVRMLKDDTGAAAAEYALILAIIGSGIALAAWGLGQDIGNAMENAGDCLTTQSAGTNGTAPSAGC